MKYISIQSSHARQVKLTQIGMDHKYRKAKKAYRDYINK